MSFALWLAKQWLFPPPETAATRAVKKTIDLAITTVDVAELVNETLPEDGPQPEEDMTWPGITTSRTP